MNIVVKAWVYNEINGTITARKDKKKLLPRSDSMNGALVRVQTSVRIDERVTSGLDDLPDNFRRFRRNFESEKVGHVDPHGTSKQWDDARQINLIINFDKCEISDENIWLSAQQQKQIPIPGIKPRPPGWEPGILTTRPYRIDVFWPKKNWFKY